MMIQNISFRLTVVLLLLVLFTACYFSKHSNEIDFDSASFLPREMALEILTSRMAEVTKPTGLILYKKNSGGKKALIPYEKIYFNIYKFNFALGLSESYGMHMFTGDKAYVIGIKDSKGKAKKFTRNDFVEIGTALRSLGAREWKDSINPLSPL